MIFNLLNLNELLTASLVCIQWYAISNHPSIAKKYMFNVNSENQMESLITSNRFFSNITFGFHLRNCNQLPLYHKFWKNHLNNIEYVCLEGIQDINLILNVLFRSHTLKTLEFRKINYLFSLGNVTGDKQTCSITKLSFGNLVFDNLKVPMKILSLIPKLESLQLKTFKMDSSFLMYLGNPEFTSTLRSLDLFCDVYSFSSKYVRKNFLNFLRFKHFDLEHFSFSFKTIVFTQNDQRKIVRFFLTQKNLKSLKILTCGEIVIFDQLISKLQNLKKIGVEIQSEIDPYLMYSNEFLLEKFKIFWNLECLEIYLNKFYLFTYPIFDSLTGPCKLKNLHMIRSDLTKIISRMQFLTMLTVLTITDSYITDPLLQSIFKYLLNLRDLRLISTHDVSTIFYQKKKYLCLTDYRMLRILE